MLSDNEDLIFGFDIGTTAVKGVLFSQDGKNIFARRIACPNHSPKVGWVEQDPEAWIDCIKNIVYEASVQVDINTIKAVGICGQVNTHIFVGADGRPLENAIIWQDQRCADIAEELEHRASKNGLLVSIDSSSLLSRAEWVAQNRADEWRRTKWILSPKDYCVLRLTGKIASDPLSSIGLVNAQGIYDLAPISLIDGLDRRLPELKAITDITGDCSNPDIPLKCPVAVSTMDAWASLYGSGLSRPGEGFQVAGTSEIIGLLSNEQQPTPGIVTFPPANDLFLHAGPTQAGGDALTWFAQAMKMEISEVLSNAENEANRNEPLIFLPYLMGERAPIWDATARGTFCGLTKRHKQADMALAMLEGVGYSAKHLLEEIEKAAAFECDNLRLSGGGSVSDFWCQIKANTMDRTLERVRNIDTGTFGAALIAMVSIGYHDDLKSAMGSTVKIGRVFEPDLATKDWYGELYQIYRETYSGLTPVFTKLSRMQNRCSNH